MKSFLLMWLALAAAVAVAGQACPDYDRLIREAEEFKTHNEFQKSINKYISAKTCNSSKATEIDAKIVEIRVLQKMAEINLQDKPIGKGPQTTIQSAPTKVTTDVDSGSNVAAMRFSKENKDWMKGMPAKDKALLMADVVRLNKLNRTDGIDSLESFFRLLYETRYYDTTYLNYGRQNVTSISGTQFPAGKKEEINFYTLKVLDYLFWMGWKKIELSVRLLPDDLKIKYQPQVTRFFNSMEAHRRSSIGGYWMPDTLISLPADALFSRRCADSKNFAWAFSSYEDYKKIQVRYLNLSLIDFTLTKDSTLILPDSGRFYNITAAASNYRYKVNREIHYALKKNKVEYERIEYAEPEVKKLVDNEGNVLFDFSKYSSNNHYFSPDAGYVATWDDGSLLLLDVAAGKMVPLPNSNPVPTESFAPDSKTIAYYNEKTKLIYFSDMEGHIKLQISGEETGIHAPNNIDFTGDDNFLKVNNDDSVSLFDIKNRKMIMRFSKKLVDEIVVSPDGKDILLTCNTTYESGGKAYGGYLALITDAGLNIKTRLYSDCSSFFYTPGGEYIVGYGESCIMRWATANFGQTRFSQSCLSIDEMVKYNCLPVSQWAGMNDADLIEKGARGFKDLAEEETDPWLRLLYYQQSKALWGRLILGNAKNIRKERVPFFYDWTNWTDRRMGYKNFSDQVLRQITAVKVFDRLVNSPDSTYPEQLFYAANGNMLLGNLYDSVHMYNNDFIDQIYKEISLRQRVFDKNPDHADNVDYYIKALNRLTAICDTVGWRNLLNGHYTERLAIYSAEERLLGEKMRTLPDSFDIKSNYINSLTQLGASFLYIHASHAEGYSNALDSALYYTNKAFALTPDKYDSARLLIVKARIYLLKPGGLENSIALYREVKDHYPYLTKEALIKQMQLLKEAGARNIDELTKVEEFINKEM